MNGGFMDNSFEPKTIGERIKYLREKNGESQVDLGKILNRTQMAISKIENDETSLTLENQILIAEHYNVSHDYLITGRNNDSVLSLLCKYISLRYVTNTEGDDVSIKYPVMEIAKPLYAFLVNTAQASTNKYMPDDIKKIWIQRETNSFYENNKDNDLSEKESIVPLPPKLLFPDSEKDSWKQSDLLRELNTLIFDTANKDKSKENNLNK